MKVMLLILQNIMIIFFYNHQRAHDTTYFAFEVINQLVRSYLHISLWLSNCLQLSTLLFCQCDKCYRNFLVIYIFKKHLQKASLCDSCAIVRLHALLLKTQFQPDCMVLQYHVIWCRQTNCICDPQMGCRQESIATRSRSRI